MGSHKRGTQILRLQGAVATLVLVAAVSIIGVAGAVEDAELPTAIHGAVETQALTLGNGALALFVDPGTAYAYSTLDRDDYGGGSLSYTMTARGANLNLGTIAYAVIWAAPDCSADGNYGCIASGGEGTPNTGLHEAAGFPLYAEALYPPPPPEKGESREYVYKCVVNKDAPGAAPTGGAAQEVCKSSDLVPLSAWAEAPGKDIRATGFSRAAGLSSPFLAVGASESHSDVRYIGKGQLQSVGTSSISDISIMGGAIRIEQSSVAGRIVSGVNGEATRAAECTFSGMTIAGEKVSVNDISNGNVQTLLDSVADATGYRVRIFPPSPVVTAVTEGGKHVAACSGVKVFITDLHEGSPVPVCFPQISPDLPTCVPALGNRVEITFGAINVQQAVNNLAGRVPGIGTDRVGGGSVIPSGTTTSPDDASTGETSVGSSDVDANPPTDGAVTEPAPDLALEGGQTQAVSAGDRNLGAIGALTALATTSLFGAILMLIGVVNALGNGGRFRFPTLGL
jgi:hypothetical protein